MFAMVFEMWDLIREELGDELTDRADTPYWGWQQW